MIAGRRLRGRGGATGLVAIGVFLTLAACTTAPADPSATALPDGVTAQLVQLRADVAVRQAQVSVRNAGDEPLVVGDLSVTDPRFDGSAERVVDKLTTIAPGTTVDIRVQLPPIACDASDAEGVAPAGTMLTLPLADAGATATVPLAEPAGFLDALVARECLAEQLAVVADVELVDFTADADAARAQVVLRVSPTGAGEALIADVRPTPLLQYVADAPAAPYPLDVAIAADAQPVDVVIPLTPQRCDAHVVQEDKRGTIFTLGVTVGDVAGTVDVPAPDDMKARMLSWVADACDFGDPDASAG